MMNLIQYMLIPVGLSNTSKTFDLIFRSITYSTFLILSPVTLFALPLYTPCTHLTSIGMKLSISICFWSLYSSYRLMKNRIEEFVEMFDEIQVVKNKRCGQNRCNFSLLFFLVCYLTTLAMIIHNAFFNPARFETIKQVKMKLLLYQHGLITVVVILYWYFVVQFVHFELSWNYYSYLSHSNKIINRYIAFNPNFVIRYQIHQVITNFEENRQKWSQTVTPLKRIIRLSIMTLNLIMIFPICL